MVIKSSKSSQGATKPESFQGAPKPESFLSIDALQFSERMKRMRQRYFDEAPMACGDRIRLAVESWKETENEHIELRRAKMLKKILEGVPVVIHDDELTVGSQTRFFRGAHPYIDWDAEYFMPEVMEEKEGGRRKTTFGSPALFGYISEEDWQACREAVAYFKGKTAAETMREISKDMWGGWHQDIKEARGFSFTYEAAPYIAGVPLFEKVVERGLGSIIREAEAQIQRFASMEEDDLEKLYFWQAVIISCEGVINFSKRYAELARQMALREEDEERQQELEEIAKACEWVPENPARTLHEAIQAFRMTHLAVLMESAGHPASPGRVDQYLYPCFKRDIEEGRLTLGKAADLVADFFSYLARMEDIFATHDKQLNQSTATLSVTLGGVTKDGKDATNELTYLFLHVAGLARYAEPHLAFRWHPVKTPRWFLTKGLETNRLTPGTPMYSNDQHIVDTMVGWGVTLEEARDFVFHGCSQTVANPMRFYRPYHVSAPFSLDLALHNGISTVSGKRIGLATGDPRSFKTFEEVYEAFKKQHEFILKRGMYLIRVFHRALLLRWRAPLTSALHYGCIERGAEYVAGGSGDYPLWYIKDRGLVDVGDSLMAIKKLMSEDKKLTMAELLEALDSNFQGERGEEIHHMCLAAPKYGNDVDEADYMVRDVAKFSASVIRSENNVFGWKYAVNRNGVAWHYAASKGVGALPNGRKVGEPFYDGSLSPMRGMDKDGPSAVLNSALKADYKEAAQSILNQKFSLDMVQSSEALDKVAMLTETFLRSGGSHIQYNFLDKQVLLEAKKHPERYRDLIVRVAGYSAYFVNLTSEVQDDIICRTEQGV